MIFSELLNIHKKSEWSKEFGLDNLSIKTLLFSSSMDFVVSFGAAGVYFQLFPGRQEISPKFCIGRELDKTDAFHHFRDTKDIDRDYLIYDGETRTSSFEKVQAEVGDKEVKQYIYIPLLQTNNRFLGYMVLYLNDPVHVSKLHETAIRQFRDIVILRLNLNREKRLRQDISEIQNLIANANHHPIFAKDKDFRIVYANDAFLNFYPPEQRDKVIGYTTLESYNADEVEEFVAEDREAFAKGITKTIEKISFPSGKTRIMETTKRRFSTSAGMDYILGVSYDLTDEKVVIDELKKRNAELDKFSNIASQDLRGPLNSILKLLEWTLEDLDPEENQDAIDNLHQIQLKAGRIHTLLEDLFEYSSVGRDQHEATHFGLRSFVMKIVPSLDMPENAKLAIDDVEVSLPRTPMEKVFTHLLKNAIEHANVDPLQLSIRVKKDKNNFVISIEDNGEGIDVRDHDVVFQLFETLSPQFEKAGSGKGLALVKKIVETYQGSIQLLSEKGKGCRIDMSWPTNL